MMVTSNEIRADINDNVYSPNQQSETWRGLDIVTVVEQSFDTGGASVLAALIKRFRMGRQKAVFSDIDGVISRGPWVNESGISELVSICSVKGFHLILTTGRPFDNAQFLASLSQVRMLISFNGGLICEGKRILKVSEDLSAVLEYLCQNHGNWDVRPCRLHIDSVGDITVDLVVPGDIPEDSLRTAVRRVGKGKIHVNRSTKQYHIGNFDKGQALVWACRYLGIHPLHSVAIGDSPLDVPMFKKAGIAIAIQGASPEVQSYAHLITKRQASEALLDIAPFLRLL